jgi:hypothetical protein
MESTEISRKILTKHLHALQANRIEAIMENYSSDAVLITPEGCFSGITEIQSFFEKLFHLLPADRIVFSLKKQTVCNDIAYIIWTVEAPKINIDFGSDTFIIQGGKIIRQTFAGQVKFKPSLLADSSN